VIDLDAAIAAHPADKGLPMESVEPAIRIDQARQWWQDGQLGAGHLRRHIATGEPLMGTLSVGVGEEALGHLTHLLERVRPMDLQAFRSERAMVPFDVAIAVGTLRRADGGRNAQRDATSGARRKESHRCSSCPQSEDPDPKSAWEAPHAHARTARAPPGRSRRGSPGGRRNLAGWKSRRPQS
jgi:hypothetical protein